MQQCQIIHGRWLTSAFLRLEYSNKALRTEVVACYVFRFRSRLLLALCCRCLQLFTLRQCSGPKHFW